jgi:FAD/FMN-containing dehydrogenase
LERRGGVISAEHGIGLDKRTYLGHSRSTAEIDLMKTIKIAMDPKNLLNPGKILEIRTGEL